MRQGTISVLFGCHSIIHSYYVIKAWKDIYKKCPNFMEIICILLHDIGHWGLDYLDNPEDKDEHWVLGADFAHCLFGSKGYKLVAGHTSHSNCPESKMRMADKQSWLHAPEWWLISNQWFEPKLRRPNMTRRQSAIYWKNAVAAFCLSGIQGKSLHDEYIKSMEDK